MSRFDTATRSYSEALVSYGVNYNGVPIPAADTRPDLAKPVIYWTPVIAPGNLLFYNGSMFPQWRGSALMGGMATQTLNRITFDGKGGAMPAERYSVGHRIRDVEVGPDGAVYAAGSPGGKVYRLDSGGKASLYYDTKAQYVWSLAFSGPVLFAATGLPGEIHRVEAAGRGKRVHASSDAHVRTLHAAGNGEVWAGTSGTGLVLRIDSSGKATTVYDSGKTEVTAIASGPDGRVWAAVSSSVRSRFMTRR